MYWNARNWKSLNWNWVYIYSKLIFYRFFFYHSCTLYKHITKCEKGKDKWETNAVWWAFETQIVWLFAIFRNDASYTSDTHAYARNRAYNAWHCNMIKHGIVVFVIHYPLRSMEKQQQQQQLCPYCWNWSQVHDVQQFMYARTHTRTYSICNENPIKFEMTETLWNFGQTIEWTSENEVNAHSHHAASQAAFRLINRSRA